jgi:hypothetical protein
MRRSGTSPKKGMEVIINYLRRLAGELEEQECRYGEQQVADDNRTD